MRKNMLISECISSPLGPEHSAAHKSERTECLKSEVLRFIKIIRGELSFQSGTPLLCGFFTWPTKEALLGLSRFAYSQGWPLHVVATGTWCRNCDAVNCGGEHRRCIGCRFGDEHVSSSVYIRICIPGEDQFTIGDWGGGGISFSAQDPAADPVA